MSNEIQADYASGSTLYAAIRSSLGQVWCVAAGAFEDWGDSGHAAADYSIALTDRDGSRYVGDFDTAIPAGAYSIQIFLQAGVAPANDDALIDSRRILWTGAGEITPIKLLANKAVQDNLTGAVDYYDDDGQTVLLTVTPSHTDAAVTMQPGGSD
jgi:hypothetical protein